MVPAEKLKETAMQAARTIVAQPAGSVWVTKGLLRRSVRDLVEAAAKREQDSFIPMLNSPEAKEALSAFMEKRKPDFSKC
jgi:enoyl-CoA hydratase/carnithine racemase